MYESDQSKIKILIVEDDLFFQSIVKAGLNNFSDISVVGTCEDGDQVLEFCSKTDIDIIIMDYDMKRVNGDQATKCVKEIFPKVKIIAHSSNDDLWHKFRMLDCGASCYLPKSLKFKRLYSIIKALHYYQNQENQIYNYQSRSA